MGNAYRLVGPGEMTINIGGPEDDIRHDEGETARRETRISEFKCDMRQINVDSFVFIWFGAEMKEMKDQTQVQNH